MDLYVSWIHFVIPHHLQSNRMIETKNREIEKNFLIENEQE